MATKNENQVLIKQIKNNRKSIIVNSIKIKVMKIVVPVLILICLLAIWKLLINSEKLSELFNLGLSSSKIESLLSAIVYLPVAVVFSIPAGFIIKTLLKIFLYIWCDSDVNLDDNSSPKDYSKEADINLTKARKMEKLDEKISKAQLITVVSSIVVGIVVFIYFLIKSDDSITFGIIVGGAFMFAILALLGYGGFWLTNIICIGYKPTLQKETKKLTEKVDEYWKSHDPEEKQRRKIIQDQRRKSEEERRKSETKQTNSYNYSGYSGSFSSSSSERSFTQGGSTGCGIGGSFCGCGSGR